jgi:hypothetical protein
MTLLPDLILYKKGAEGISSVASKKSRKLIAEEMNWTAKNH